MKHKTVIIYEEQQQPSPHHRPVIYLELKTLYFCSLQIPLASCDRNLSCSFYGDRNKLNSHWLSSRMNVVHVVLARQLRLDGLLVRRMMIMANRLFACRYISISNPSRRDVQSINQSIYQFKIEDIHFSFISFPHEALYSLGIPQHLLPKQDSGNKCVLYAE